MIAGISARVRSLWRGLRRRPEIEAEMQEEFRFHVDARVEDLVRAGLSRPEAVRQAGVEFGSFERHKHEARGARGLRVFDELAFSWLDVKLAFRMLRRYPGLTLVGGLAMAFGIGAAVVGFEITTQVMNPRLPLDDGDRIVALQNWHVGESRAEAPLLEDFVTWRDELESIEQLGVFRSAGRNLVVDDQPETVAVAEISATGFAVARVPPLLGRGLNVADEAAGAPPVLVIGHDVWQTRFDGDAHVVGRIVRSGNVPTTIVGVMPAGFGFPLAHSYWVPLHTNAVDVGPELVVFGRLAAGVSIEAAQSELATIGARAAAASPETHALLRPRIVPLTRALFDPGLDFAIGLGFFNVFLLALIVLACANVALLLFARAATREVELAIKNALGAQRGRLVLQFFAEALVLAGLATAIGLGVARWGLHSFMAMAEENGSGALPFWVHGSLTPTSVIYSSALTLLAALIAGVLPALMVTRGDHRTRLARLTAGGTGTARIGGAWTALIVVQVAVTVLFPATALNFKRWASPLTSTALGLRAEEYLSARLAGGARSARPSRQGEAPSRIREELARRLMLEPGVLGVTFASRLPGVDHEQAWFELDGQEAPAESAGHRASVASVAADWFDVLERPIVAGRGFLESELRSTAGVAIVNQGFVDQALDGRNPIGRSIRRAAHGDRPAGPWHEVVGVAANLGMMGNAGAAGVYFPLDPDAPDNRLVARVRGDLGTVASRLRRVALDVDPELELHEVMSLAQVAAAGHRETLYFSRILTAISAGALLLSLMAIYSVVDFTVSKRTREIGVRVALGAAPHSILRATFKRPLVHVGLGILVGGLLVVGVSGAMFGTFPGLVESGLIAAYVVGMWAVCMLACVVPTRRALRVQPTEALRADG